ncbi:MAG: HD domain-containing protein [Candidatus Freyarchaeota archaeon]|nr:HD domain-containing protein [Candidatus Jordarchaeia archaeon]MBS7269063.1 HD domain-containing protein [Candidatus Jordarchaeia archaeon]MBS7279891.1 HD domain-containing protein [Candidatus Jordarchaeia archaeon]
MYFQDVIHGKIRVNELEQKLLGTSVMKSLSEKMDIGNINLVYPGARHTRLEHSLGTLHVANRICDTLLKKGYKIGEEVEIIRLSALLHDVGHGPFSHGSEIILQEKTGLTHEEMGKKIVMDEKSEINEVLRDSGLSKGLISEIANNILGVNKRRPFIGEIIHGMVDADKLDYLPRDSLSTGFLPHLVQSSHIIDSMKILDEHIVFEKSVVPYLDSMVFAEAIYYRNIHHHPTVRKADQTLSRAIKIAVEKGITTIFEIQKMTDEQIISFLKKAGGTITQLTSKIHNKPLDTILTIKWEELDKDIVKQLLKVAKDKQEKENIENSIAEHINSDPHLTILDIPELPSIQEANTPIMLNDEKKSLRDISSITRAISENQPTQWTLHVYSEKAPKESLEGFRKFFLSQI